jgi:hypothetical protein
VLVLGTFMFQACDLSTSTCPESPTCVLASLCAVLALAWGSAPWAAGGIPNLMRGEVNAATNAEAQLLRQPVDDPSLRVILTEAESF